MQLISVCPGADPGVGKGRSTNKLSGWGEQILFAIAAFLKPLFSSVTRLIFAILAFADGCEVLKMFKRLFNIFERIETIIIFRGT